jgi:hypothetical protein
MPEGTQNTAIKKCANKTFTNSKYEERTRDKRKKEKKTEKQLQKCVHAWSR